METVKQYLNNHRYTRINYIDTNIHQKDNKLSEKKQNGNGP